MKKFLPTLVFAVFVGSTMSVAQDNTMNLTFFNEFKPAVVHMANGKKVKTSLANIFLKNAALLYKRGDTTMEANMEPVVAVDIDTLHFLKIDNMLAQFVDSVGENKLYCITLIDIESYKTILRNNVNISNLSLGDQISYATIDLSSQEGVQLPLIRHFYYIYNGELIRVHEREISRRLKKENKRIYKTVISLDGFSWVDASSLMTLLKAISD